MYLVGEMDDDLFGEYTDVQELTIFVPSYARGGEGAWFLLCPLLQRGIPSQQIHTIRVVVVDAPSNVTVKHGEGMVNLYWMVEAVVAVELEAVVILFYCWVQLSYALRARHRRR